MMTRWFIQDFKWIERQDRDSRHEALQGKDTENSTWKTVERNNQTDIVKYTYRQRKSYRIDGLTSRRRINQATDAIKGIVYIYKVKKEAINRKNKKPKSRNSKKYQRSCILFSK